MAASACLVAVAGCRAPAATSAGSPLSQEACIGVPESSATCYRLTVSENRTAATGRTIALRIVVLPATSPDRAEDPVVYLAGGPGQAATELIGETSLVDDALRGRRDLVFADQRGTGGSNALICQFYGPPDNLQSYFDAFLPLEKVRACRAALERKADLAQYTTAASVADLEAIRLALGYRALNLVGVSYGTRLAMEYVRRYPDRVRSVVLDGPVPPGMHAPEGFGRLAAGALDGVLDECRSSAPCAAAYPALRERTVDLFDRLRRASVTARVSHPTARGVEGDVTLTRDHVAEAIRYMLYTSQGASYVPLFLHEAAGGNFAPLAGFLLQWRHRGTFDGLYLSITCAEDVPLVAAAAAAEDAPTFLGGYRVRQQRAACAVWPRGAGPADHTTPVSATVPTFISSGMLDPVTPSSNGDEIAKTLPRSMHVRIPFGGHSPAGLAGVECVSTLKRRFIETARVDALDASCTSRVFRPGFVISPTGR